MPCSRNMTSAHAVDDLGYALADAGSPVGTGPMASPNILSLSNLDCEGKNWSVSNRDEH